jgi:hypothetical protein
MIVRGEPNAFRDNWIAHTVTTPAGELQFTALPGSEPFIGCTKLDGVPIAPADAHRVLEQLGDEHAAMAYIGDGTLIVSPRRPM